MQVQYRNCNYVGDFDSESYLRNGYGLLIFDNSHIIMAKWRNNSVNGPFVMITDRLRILGTMNNNKLQGYNVISLQESLISNKKEKQRTIYGMFKENKLYGKAIVIDGDQIIIGHYVDGKLKQASDRKVIRERQVYDMLQTYFPKQIYNITDWLAQIFTRASRQFNFENSYKCQPIFTKFQNNDTQFYGYIEIFTKSRGFGFVMHQGQVISIGDHQNDILQGIGRLYHHDGVVEDGVFKNGQLNGIGINYSKKNHKYVIGQFNAQNQEFQKGFGFPMKQITEIRRQFHLRSINFYNDIVLFSFSTIFQAICTSSLQYPIQHQSPRFINTNQNISNSREQIRPRGLSQKSLIKNKIDQYQQQSQHIQDPSPIKSKQINQYQRNNDHLRSKYFQNQQIRERERQQRDQREQYQYENSKTRGRSNTQKNNRTPQRNYNQRNYNQRNYNQRNYNQRNYNNERERQGNSQSRRVKDTRQLVRQLDEKQKARRGYLDQIYKQAKLYSKRS